MSHHYSGPNIGFWGSAGTNGWSYDTMIIVMNLVIVTTAGDDLSLARWFT